MNSWNYYSYQSNSADNLVININQLNEKADCDLYARQGGEPTTLKFGNDSINVYQLEQYKIDTNQYYDNADLLILSWYIILYYILLDYIDTSRSANYSLSIPSPGRALWYLGVLGWANCNYTVTVSESSKENIHSTLSIYLSLVWLIKLALILPIGTCPNQCNGKGECNNGICICRPSSAGTACEKGIHYLDISTSSSRYYNITNSCYYKLDVIALENGKMLRDTIGVNVWNYYSITVNDSSSLHVMLREQPPSEGGYIWVSINEG